MHPFPDTNALRNRNDKIYLEQQPIYLLQTAHASSESSVGFIIELPISISTRGWCQCLIISPGSWCFITYSKLVGQSLLEPHPGFNPCVFTPGKGAKEHGDAADFTGIKTGISETQWCKPRCVTSINPEPPLPRTVCTMILPYCSLEG